MPTRRIALAALFCGAAAIGSSALLVKLSEAGPVSTAFWRVALALPVLWAWAAYARRRAPRPATARDTRFIVLAGLFFAGDLAVWHWSILLTSVANATLLANCAPIFVTLAAWFLYGHRPGGRFLAGLVTAIAGAFLLLRGDFTHTDNRALAGDALGVVTAMFYAAYQIAVSKARGTASTARVMAASGTVTALALLPLALASGETFVPSTANGWTVVVALALISQAGGQSLIAYALAHLPGTFASLGLLVQPIVAATLAWIVLGEALTALAITGGVLVLAGIRIARPAGPA